MSLQVFTAGENPTAAKLNAVSRQTVTVCTSSTRPGTPDEGMTIYETDTNTMYAYDGGDWCRVVGVVGAMTPYTVTVAGITGGDATVEGSYYRVGPLVFFRIAWVRGASGPTWTDTPTFTLPVTAKNQNAHGSISVNAIDISATPDDAFGCGFIFNSTTVISVWAQTTWNESTAMTSTTPFTWASGDIIAIAGWYEAG